MDSSASGAKRQGPSSNGHGRHPFSWSDGPLASPAEPATGDDGPEGTALRLLEMGFWPIALYPPGVERKGKEPTKGKEPFGGAWGARRATAASLMTTYGGRPRFGVGLCLGPGRGPGEAWLIDVEGDGPEAEESRLKLFGGEVVDTMGWRSERGSHSLFTVGSGFLEAIQAAGGVEGKGLKVGVYKLPELPGLEIRIGGYKSDGTVKQIQSACPPSRSEAGVAREWNGCLAVAEIPDAALSFLEGVAERKAIQRKGEAAPARGANPPAWSPTSRWLQAALFEETERVAGAAEGRRNESLNTAAFNLGQIVGAGIVGEATVVSMLTAAAKHAGLPDGEIETTLQSGLQSGKKQPRKVELDVRPQARPSTNGKPAEPMESMPRDQATADVTPKLAELPRTDLGNAQRLVARFGDRFRWCKPWGTCLVWDGRRWAEDTTDAVVRLAKRAARAIGKEATGEKDDAEAKAVFRWAMTSQSKKSLDAMVALARSEEGIPILPEQLDRDPWAFNCRNGTLDLKTCKLRPHRREDLITKVCPEDFDADAKCPLWESTLDLFFGGNQDLIDYWQRICGYALVGVVRDHALPIAHGLGSNGKSTILGALLDTFGKDYAMKCPPDMLMAKRGDPHPTDRADLFGKRLVVAIETESGRMLNETMVKELTGGDAVRARRMRENFWEFKPTHTLIMATNHRPKIRGTDKGIWRRLKLIPFNVTVEGDKDDTSMSEKLEAERAGILAWCVRGCLAWQERGLDEPECVKDATSEYRQEQDVLGGFLAEHTLQLEGKDEQCGKVFSRYREWAEATGEQQLSMTAFGQAMRERGFDTRKNGVKYYMGIKLRDIGAGRGTQQGAAY